MDQRRVTASCASAGAACIRPGLPLGDTGAVPRLIIVALILVVPTGAAAAKPRLALNDRGYFSMPGLDVMAFQDFYPEGHQGAVSIIQNGVRVASNGDLRLEPAPGQWAPVPVQKDRVVDAKAGRGAGEIVTTLAYPDPDKDRKGFNPIEYPKLAFSYRVRVRPEGAAVRVLVDLTEPLPAAWSAKVGFNLELYPAALFGKTFYSSPPLPLRSPLPAQRGEGQGEGSGSAAADRARDVARGGGVEGPRAVSARDDCAHIAAVPDGGRCGEPDRRRGGVAGE